VVLNCACLLVLRHTCRDDDCTIGSQSQCHEKSCCGSVWLSVMPSLNIGCCIQHACRTCSTTHVPC
jgi:hypothetical protein